MKRGVTLATISIVILIMIILITTITTTGSMALNNSKKLRFASELAFVQEMVDEYVNNKEGEYPIGNSIILGLSDVTSNSLPQFDEETKEADSIILYEVDFSLLGKTDLIYGTKENGDKEDVYAVSKETGKVYYIKGIKVRDITYYTLTDELKEMIDYTSNVGAVTKDGIIFHPSHTNWTNKNIQATVSVPLAKEYTEVNVAVVQNNQEIKNIDNFETKNHYQIYSITDVEGNYNIMVNYQKNGVASTQEFSVSNFDNEAPTFTVDEIKPLVNEEDNVKQTYISLTLGNDISGIAHIKYETENIDKTKIKQYFASNGIEVSNNTIMVDKFAKYVTIYVEDKAGNYTSQTVTLNTTLSTNDYIANGLVAFVDGINNTGNGHNAQVRTWKNLTSVTQDGVLNGNPIWKNNGLYFDGVDDYVNLGEMNHSNVTFESVVEINDLNKKGCILGNWNNGGGVHYESQLQKMRATLYIKEASKYYACDTQESVHTNTKYYLSMTYDGNQIKTYINGVLQDFVKIQDTIGIPTGNNPITIGVNMDNNTTFQEFLNGTVYTVRVYDRALTEKEVSQNYRVDKIRYGIE